MTNAEGRPAADVPGPARPRVVSTDSVAPPRRKAPGEEPESTLFELVGGRPFFDELVDRFYAGVEADPRLRPMYPDDLTDSKAHLAGFLAQFWGGGVEQYSAERGHPRLRQRHVPFEIGDEEAAAWMEHMTAALDSMDVAPEVRGRMFDHMAQAALFLRNR